MEGPNKYECVATVDPQMVKKGAKVYFWMKYMVPKHTNTKMTILVMRQRRPEKVKDFDLWGAVSMRIFVASKNTVPIPSKYSSNNYLITADNILDDIRGI
ncbi:MAG: hypothetical protein C0615_08875 [Desulfuromonas sp.]|nr:MAG: hypothetical protein C0615_08875 [Desulfuromonas sp.]